MQKEKKKEKTSTGLSLNFVDIAGVLKPTNQLQAE